MNRNPNPVRQFVTALLLVGVGMFATALLGAQATANAAPLKEYVAIAYSPVDKQAALSMHANRDTAIAGALSRCGQKAGHCQLVAWSQGGCAALAVNGEQYYGWYGSSYAQAQQGALQRAGGGSILMSQCVTR